MDLTPSEVRKKTFELVRRGFDPQEVGAFLEKVSETLATLQHDAKAAAARLETVESQLTEARSAEEAVRLTMMAATQAKEEILSKANAEAAEMGQSAKSEADHVLAAARRDADSTLSDARREALALLEASRSDAEDLVTSARAENKVLLERAGYLRRLIDRTQNMLTSLAEGAAGELKTATSLLDDAQHEASSSHPFEVDHTGNGHASRPPLEVVAAATPRGDDEMSPAGTLDNDESARVREEVKRLVEGMSNLDTSVVRLPDAVDRLLSQLRDASN